MDPNPRDAPAPCGGYPARATDSASADAQSPHERGGLFQETAEGKPCRAIMRAGSTGDSSLTTRPLTGEASDHYEPNSLGYGECGHF